jgi:histidine triad (HIT) family protein
MSDSSCVFCKIVAGSIPALRVYEDADILAFLDVGPLAEGHLLVIPKPHVERLEDMSPDLIGQLARQLPRLAAAVVKATGVSGYNLLQNNGKVASQEVEHVHFHIIPRKQGDGLGYRWKAGSYPSGRGEEVRQRLHEALAGS